MRYHQPQSTQMPTDRQQVNKMWHSQRTEWKWKCPLLSHVRLFVTPWTVAHHGISVHGISHVGVLEWVAISFSKESSRPKYPTQVSCITGRFFFFFLTIWATRETQRTEYHTAKRVDNLQQHPMVWLNNLNMVFSGRFQVQKDEYLITRGIYSINIKPGKFVPGAQKSGLRVD